MESLQISLYRSKVRSSPDPKVSNPPTVTTMTLKGRMGHVECFKKSNLPIQINQFKSQQRNEKKKTQKTSDGLMTGEGFEFK